MVKLEMNAALGKRSAKVASVELSSRLASLLVTVVVANRYEMSDCTWRL